MIKITTKNLFDENSVAIGSLDSNYLTFPYSTATQSAKTFFFECKPNTAYTVSFRYPGDRLYIFTADEILDYKSATTADKIQFNRSYIAKKNSIPTMFAFVTGEDAKMCAIYYTYTAAPEKMQIEEGNTATPYIPHFLEISRILQTTVNGTREIADVYIKAGNGLKTIF